MIINDSKFAASDIFVTVGDELRYWEITETEIHSYDIELIPELAGDLLNCISISKDFTHMAVGSVKGVVSLWLLNGFQFWVQKYLYTVCHISAPNLTFC